MFLLTVKTFFRGIKSRISAGYKGNVKCVSNSFFFTDISETMLASLAVVPSSWRKEEHRSEELLYVTEVLLICKLLDDPEPYLKTPPLTVNS